MSNGYKPRYLFIYEDDEELEDYMEWNYPFRKDFVTKTQNGGINNMLTFHYKHYVLYAVKKNKVSKDCFYNLRGYRFAKITITKNLFKKITNIDLNIIFELGVLTSVSNCLGSDAVKIYEVHEEIKREKERKDMKSFLKLIVGLLVLGLAFELAIKIVSIVFGIAVFLTKIALIAVPILIVCYALYKFIK